MTSRDEASRRDEALKKEAEARKDGSSGIGDEKHVASAGDRCYWDGRAEEFSEYATSTGYAERFIELVDPGPDWSILDMGCGGGTLAVPLAGRVESVTAIDFSSSMLDIVRKRCSKAGITNVTTVQARWEDDWENLGIGAHDVAIASRSLIGDAPEAFIRKLDKIASRFVYISTLVGDGPFDRRLFKASGRRFKAGQDYIHYYNLLHRMGIYANVAFVREMHRNSWENHDLALEDQQWMFRGMTEKERGRVSAYLKRNLVRKDGRWELPYSRDCQWAVMWWPKEQGRC